MFLVNAPSFSESSTAVRGGDFVIRTQGFVEPVAGGPVQYVQSATLDGDPLERTWITGEEFHRGGELVVELGSEPSAWGTVDVPPSMPAEAASIPGSDSAASAATSAAAEEAGPDTIVSETLAAGAAAPHEVEVETDSEPGDDESPHSPVPTIVTDVADPTGTAVPDPADPDASENPRPTGDTP
jgi:hypothetical protein